MPPADEPFSVSRFQMLEADHRVMELLLAGHQEALLGFELSSALAKLEEFARRLRQHIRAEEELLAAAESLKLDWPRGGTPEILRQEHGKIEEKLTELLGAMRGVSRGSGRKVVLAILERGVRFKSLLEHHVQREEEIVLPALKALASGARPRPA